MEGTSKVNVSPPLIHTMCVLRMESTPKYIACGAENGSIIINKLDNGRVSLGKASIKVYSQGFHISTCFMLTTWSGRQNDIESTFSQLRENPIHSGCHQWGIGSLAARFCPGNGWEMISGSNDCTLKVWSVNDELGFQNYYKVTRLYDFELLSRNQMISGESSRNVPTCIGSFENLD